MSNEIYPLFRRGKVTGLSAGPEDGYGTVGEGDDGRNVLAAGQFNQLAQQMTMPFMDPVEYADGDDGLFAGVGAGQTLPKAHSWLVLIAPYSAAPCSVDNNGQIQISFGETGGGKTSGQRCGRGSFWRVLSVKQGCLGGLDISTGPY